MVVGSYLRKTTEAQSITEQMTKTRIEILSRGTPGLQAKVMAMQGEGMSIQDSKDRKTSNRLRLGTQTFEGLGCVEQEVIFTLLIL